MRTEQVEFHEMIEELVESRKVYALLDDNGEIRLFADIHCTARMKAHALSLDEIRQLHYLERRANRTF